MYVKVTEAAEEFVALQEANPLDWNYGPTYDAYVKLETAIKEHKAESIVRPPPPPPVSLEPGTLYDQSSFLKLIMPRRGGERYGNSSTP